MNSSFSTNSVTSLKMLLSLVTQGQLRIVSLEYTEMREKGSETLYQVQILLCKAEQKAPVDDENPEFDVDMPAKDP